tara:strand:+ start:183 stop:761 length:579 start_codon:yes stop_codon:yes gene_type:complete
MNNLFDYVTVENLVSAELSKEILNIANRDNSSFWKDHPFSHTPDKPETFHVNWSVQDCNPELDALISPIICTAIDRYSEIIKPITGYESERHGDITNQFTVPRLNRYETGDKMADHADASSITNVKHHYHAPVLSFVGLLNNDFEGGKFSIRDKEYNLKAGDVVTFPSFFMYIHGASEVFKGTRYSFVSWAH